jgi:putative transposase
VMKPAQRQSAVAWAREAYRVSERRACRVLGACRSTIRYRTVRPHREALRERLRELASVRVRSGYQQLHTLLRREGRKVNHRRVHRLYREEGLVLRRRGPKRRHRSATRRVWRKMPGATMCRTYRGSKTRSSSGPRMGRGPMVPVLT